MKTLILDEKTWRCGQESGPSSSRGKGDTALINEEGFKCCLGQFSTQLKKEVELEDHMTNPRDTNLVIPFLTRKLNNSIKDTKLSSAAMTINDDPATTVGKKVVQLKRLFKSRGLKIVFKKMK